jgi:hypothetical protein
MGTNELDVVITQECLEQLIREHLIKHVKATNERITKIKFFYNHRKHTVKAVTSVKGPRE